MSRNQNSIEAGDRFGRLVIRRDLGTVQYGVNRVRRFECLCDCGRMRVALAPHLKTGNTKSCGCLRSKKKGPRLPSGEEEVRIVIRSYRNNAKNREITFELEDDAIRQLMRQPCFYCGEPPTTVAETRSGYGRFVYNGIDRVDNNKGYVEGNVVSCCRICNLAKKDLPVEDFLRWVEHVYMHSLARRPLMKEAG